MVCPFCVSDNTSVINSRKRKKSASVWRRRICKHCHAKFSTTETLSLQDDLEVEYPQATSRLPYNRGILLNSIMSSFEHDLPRGKDAAWWLLDTIEVAILKEGFALPHQRSNMRIINSRDIAMCTFETLLRYDKAAAVQYAARHGLSLS